MFITILDQYLLYVFWTSTRGGTYNIFGTVCVALKGILFGLECPSKGILFSQSPGKGPNFRHFGQKFGNKSS